MTPVVLGLDFGSSFTKVALRPDWNRLASLLRRRDVAPDDESATCSPTVVVRNDNHPIWVYGTDAARITPSASSRVYHNWKAWLLPSPAGVRPAPVPVTSGAPSAAPSGAEFVDRTASSTRLLPDTVDDPDEEEVREIALKYFSWLRRQVERACAANRIDLRTLRVRVCVPDFVSTPAEPESFTPDQLLFSASKGCMLPF